MTFHDIDPEAAFLRGYDDGNRNGDEDDYDNFYTDCEEQSEYHRGFQEGIEAYRDLHSW